MIKFQYIIFSTEEQFKFRLKESVSFNLNKNLGKWRLLNPKSGEVVAICNNDILEIKAGYAWNGSFISDYYEDYETLEASLIQDALYNAKKSSNNTHLPFTLYSADRLFIDWLSKLYSNNKSFYMRKIFPKLYYLGLLTIGHIKKFSKEKYYKLKKAE